MSRDEQIANAVSQLDIAASDRQDAAWANLRPLGFGIVRYLLAAFPQFRTWQGRTALVYYATRYARISDDAVRLGILAASDRSYMVRYRACGLLAYSLNRDSLSVLERLSSDKRLLVARSAHAACNAIKAQNHHLFADRSLSGRTSWVVNEGDRAPGGSIPPPPSRIDRWRLGIRSVDSGNP
uniref:hypothetical protein n=1 Tax=Parerythrobacter lutipelagi TaxID=1964208 RepID=UPI0010F85ACA|nr:hypothetical protein [Parerythrobacter lutipelagi]